MTDDADRFAGCEQWGREQWKQAMAALAVRVAEADVVTYSQLWRQVTALPHPHRRLQAAKLLGAPVAAGHPNPAMLLRAARGLLDLLGHEAREPWTLYALGVTLVHLGEVPAAQALMQAVLRLEPEQQQVREHVRTLTRAKRRLARRGGAEGKQLAQQARRLADTVQPLNPADMRLSLAMIVRDEEDMLAACLESAQGVVDEMVIVDTGSVDATKQIAESFGAKVLDFEWVGSFAQARNFGLEHVTGDWVLMLDADERLITEENDTLRQLLARTWREAIVFTEVNYTGADGSGGSATHRAYRVFRNRPEYRYEGDIHEQNTMFMPMYLPERFEQTSLRILHYGYLKERIAARNKRERNMQMLLHAVQEDPDAYNHFQLGTEYMAVEDYEPARRYLQRAWEQVCEQKLLWMSWAPTLISRLAELARLQGDVAAADRYVREGLAHFPQFTDLVFLAAGVARDSQQFDRALELVEQALNMGDAPASMGGTVGVGSYLALSLKAEILELTGRRAQAIELWRQALVEHPQVMGPVAQLARALLADGQDADQVTAQLRPLIEPSLTSGGVLLASALYDAGAYQQARALFAEVVDHAPSNRLAQLGLVDATIATGDLPAAAELCARARGDAGLELLQHRALLIDVLAGRPVDTRLDQLAASMTADEIEFWRALSDGRPAELSELASGVALATLPLLLALQRFDEAERVITLIKTSRLSPLARHSSLAAVLTAAGFLRSAEDEWLELIDEIGPHPDALCGLAHIALAEQMPERALELAVEAYQRDGDHHGARRLIGSLQARMS